MPDRVAARLRQKIANPLRQAMRKANKQIAATKRLSNDPDAFGLAIFANDKNLGLSPQGVLSILGHVDKRDSTDLRPVIQAHLYVGDELGTQPDVRRRMDIL